MRTAIVLLGVCWLIFAGFWLFSARRIKQSRGPVPRGKQWVVALTMLVGFGMIVSKLGAGTAQTKAIWIDTPLWAFSAPRALTAEVLSYVGVAICVWARVALGRNWSALPGLRQGHELVTAGPYACVRHPIYTGLLLMFAAIALLWAAPAGFLALPVAAAVVQLKLSREEQLLASEFPDQWPAYRARTWRVLPLLW